MYEPTEIVRRPDPGTLARGAWEAPSWAFYASAAVVVLAAALYAAFRYGRIRWGAPWKRRETPKASPKSRR